MAVLIYWAERACREMNLAKTRDYRGSLVSDLTLPNRLNYSFDQIGESRSAFRTSRRREGPLRDKMARIVIASMLLSSARPCLAHERNTPNDQDVCSLIPASKLAPLIGGGAIVSTPINESSSSQGCKYEHPEAQDGLVPPGLADLDILDESPDEAKTRFEDELRDTIKSVREGPSAQILLVERGRDYAAYSNENQARVAYAGRFVIFVISPPGASLRTRKNSDAIRALAIQAAGATLDPNAQIGPPAGLPKRVQWTTFDEYFDLYFNKVLVGFVLSIQLVIILLVLKFTLFRRWRRRRILAHGIAATALVEEVSLTGTRVNYNPVLRLRVLIHAPMGAPYTATARKVFAVTDAPFVRPGIVLNIKIDPKRADQFEIVPAS